MIDTMIPAPVLLPQLQSQKRPRLGRPDRPAERHTHSKHTLGMRGAAVARRLGRRPTALRQRPLRRSDHSHSHNHAVRDGPPDVTIHWVFKKTGEIETVGAYFGENLMRLAQRHDIPLEGAPRVLARRASRFAARATRASVQARARA